MITEAVDRAVKAVCPIDGVSLGRKDDKATWSIQFRPEATEGQKRAAEAALAAFDLAAEAAKTAPKDRLALLEERVAALEATRAQATSAK